MDQRQFGQLLALFILTVMIIATTAENCEKLTTCTCRTESGKVVNLNSLLSPGTWFTATDGQRANYYFSPCNALNKSGCHTRSVAVCQEVNNSPPQPQPSYFDAGDIGTEIFSGDPATNELTVTYTVATKPPRTSIFTIICSGDSRLEFLSENPKTTYNFKLYAPIVCTSSDSDDDGLSAGSVLLIIFFVLFVVYWVGGFLFMKFVRRAEGVEVIPNYEFWKELPLVIRDGITFTARGCKGESTYQKI